MQGAVNDSPARTSSLCSVSDPHDHQLSLLPPVSPILQLEGTSPGGGKQSSQFAQLVGPGLFQPQFMSYRHNEKNSAMDKAGGR